MKSLVLFFIVLFSTTAFATGEQQTIQKWYQKEIEISKRASKSRADNMSHERCQSDIIYYESLLNDPDEYTREYSKYKLKVLRKKCGF